MSGKYEIRMLVKTKSEADCTQALASESPKFLQAQVEYIESTQWYNVHVLAFSEEWINFVIYQRYSNLGKTIMLKKILDQPQP